MSSIGLAKSLKGLPDNLIPVIAMRSTLRGLPGMFYGPGRSINREMEAAFPIFRSMAWLRFHLKEGISLDTKYAISLAVYLSELAKPASFEGDALLRSASYALRCAATINQDDLRKFARSAITWSYAPFGPQSYDGHIHTNQAIRNAETSARQYAASCVGNVNQKTDRTELLFSPLWNGGSVHQELRSGTQNFETPDTEVLDAHWLVWVEWYRAVLHGRSVPGEPTDYFADNLIDASVDPKITNEEISHKLVQIPQMEKSTAESIGEPTRANSASVSLSLGIIEQIEVASERIAISNSLPNEDKLQWLAAFNELKKVVTEVEKKQLGPDTESTVRASWLDRYLSAVQKVLLQTVEPDNVAQATIPTTMIFGFGALGALIAGPSGFAGGTLLGGFISNQVKPIALADKVGDLVKDQSPDPNQTER